MRLCVAWRVVLGVAKDGDNVFTFKFNQTVLDFKDEGIASLLNVRNSSPYVPAAHPTRIKN